jgi:hypothetical protein
LSDLLVEPAEQGQLGSLDRRDVADFLDRRRDERRVLRKDQPCVGAFELGVLEHANVIRLSAPAGELDMIGEVGVDRLDAAGKHRVLQAPCHHPPCRGVLLVRKDEARVGRYRGTEAGDDQQRGAALDLAVARIDGDVERAARESARFLATGLRTLLKGQHGRHGDQAGECHRVDHLCAAERPGRDRFLPVVRLVMIQGFTDDGGLQEAEPARGRGYVLFDGGQERGPQLGMFRLDPPGHPARVTHRKQRQEHASDRRGRDRAGGRHQPGARHRNGAGPLPDRENAQAE